MTILSIKLKFIMLKISRFVRGLLFSVFVFLSSGLCFAGGLKHPIFECNSNVQYDARFSMSGFVHQLHCEGESKNLFFMLYTGIAGKSEFEIRLSGNENMKGYTKLGLGTDEILLFSKYLRTLTLQTENARQRKVLNLISAAINEQIETDNAKIMIRALLTPERLNHRRKLEIEEEALIDAILAIEDEKGIVSLRSLAEDKSISKTVSVSAAYILVGMFPEDKELISIYRSRNDEFRSENKTPDVIWRGGKSKKSDE